MSREGRDSTYRAKARQVKGPTSESTRIRGKEQVDYKEVEIISSDTESEEIIINSESGIGSIKQEPHLGEQELGGDNFLDTWS